MTAYSWLTDDIQDFFFSLRGSISGHRFLVYSTGGQHEGPPELSRTPLNRVVAECYSMAEAKTVALNRGTKLSYILDLETFEITECWGANR